MTSSADTIFGPVVSPGDREPACPICSFGGAAFFARGFDRLFGLARGSFRLFQCTSCGCVFQHPAPDEATIAGFYPDSYWWEEQRQGESLVESALRRLERRYREFVAMDHVRFLLRCARQARSSGRMLLDVGCGSGTFLHLARKHGFEARGMDLSPQAVRVAQSQYGLYVRQGSMNSDAWQGCRFDFITMFHVLEHLADPGRALSFAAAHLKPEGKLIVQVPNLHSLQARLFGARWYGLDVPRHIVNFSPAGLRRLLANGGFAGETVARFSLRDNPAALASSLVPGLDPIGRRGRRQQGRPFSEAAAELIYFGFVLAAFPFAVLESALGLGATLWAQAALVRDRD